MWLCRGACYGVLVAVASRGASCSLRGWWVIVYLWADHLCNNWVVLFVLYDPGDRLDEGVRSFHQCFGLRKWPVKHDGNEHLSSIFFDEGWFSGLYLFQDCDCFVLTQVSFPLFYSSLR